MSRPAAPPFGGGEQVAVVARRGKFLVAEPFFGDGSRVALSRDSRYGEGDLVVLHAAVSGGTGRRGQGRRGMVARRIGRPDVARDVIEALMIDRGLRRRFEPVVARDAQAAAETGADPVGRRDLRDLPTFTIDPASARDYDDAISAAPLDGGEGWRVWVHIADVSAFVAPRAAVDREAYRRATSVYVPGAVEPMLPADLSNGACSLVPGVDRLAVTVEMEIGPGGVRRAGFARSLIRSDARLEYGQVDAIFTGRERAEAPWGDPLAAARAAAAALGARRSERGGLVVDSAEPVFRFDRAGHVVGAEAEAQTESHRVIEHLMIAANEQVAAFLERRGVPALFRVHERPDGTAVGRLIEQLASLGVPTPPAPDGHLTSQEAADLVGEVSVRVSQWVARQGHGGRALTSLVLRSLKQAYYDARNLGHAGLQSPRYCHFTSPIRRYPDLICHRALLATLDGSEPLPDRAWVTAAGPWTSARERAAMTIERDADDIAACFLLERELAGEDPVLGGEVVGLISAGAFVAFGEGLAYRGMLPVRRIRSDWWELNDEATMLVGTRNGGRIRLGDPIEVRVGQIDAPRGRVDLRPAWEDAG